VEAALKASDPQALEQKYRLETGGCSCRACRRSCRLPLDQHRADRRRGVDTATLISGYRGSPLGGLDQTVERHRDLLREHQVCSSRA
jgi:indolepyruvate ferredoxin oxidoreductase